MGQLVVIAATKLCTLLATVMLGTHGRSPWQAALGILCRHRSHMLSHTSEYRWQTLIQEHREAVEVGFHNDPGNFGRG